ncbi:hypothetical protein BC2230_190003 [Burkholderia cepacia]
MMPTCFSMRMKRGWLRPGRSTVADGSGYPPSDCIQASLPRAFGRSMLVNDSNASREKIIGLVLSNNLKNRTCQVYLVRSPRYSL